MSLPLTTTITEVRPEEVVVLTTDGQHWCIPLDAVAGKPVLGQPLFIHAATSGTEPGAPHPLAHAIIEHLLEPSS